MAKLIRSNMECAHKLGSTCIYHNFGMGEKAVPKLCYVKGENNFPADCPLEDSKSVEKDSEEHSISSTMGHSHGNPQKHTAHKFYYRTRKHCVYFKNNYTCVYFRIPSSMIYPRCKGVNCGNFNEHENNCNM